MPNYKPEGLLIDTPANRQAFHSLSGKPETAVGRPPTYYSARGRKKGKFTTRALR